MTGPRLSIHGVPRHAYSVAEVAESLSLGRTSVFSLIRSGQLRSFTVGARRLVVASELERYVQAASSEAAREARSDVA